jgi:hypothetical protein
VRHFFAITLFQSMGPIVFWLLLFKEKMYEWVLDFHCCSFILFYLIIIHFSFFSFFLFEEGKLNWHIVGRPRSRLCCRRLPEVSSCSQEGPCFVEGLSLLLFAWNKQQY